MSAIVQAYKRSPSGNCNATDDWKKKKQNMKLTLIYAYCGWRWHHIFSFFSWQHLKAKVCIQDQMTEGLKLIMISIACIDKEYCISTSPFLLYSWKITLCSSIMVSALDSGWRGLGLRPCQVILLCSSTKHFILTMPLSTQEYEWILANSHGSLIKCWGVT